MEIYTITDHDMKDFNRKSSLMGLMYFSMIAIMCTVCVYFSYESIHSQGSVMTTVSIIISVIFAIGVLSAGRWLVPVCSRCVGLED